MPQCALTRGEPNVLSKLSFLIVKRGIRWQAPCFPEHRASLCDMPHKGLEAALPWTHPLDAVRQSVGVVLSWVHACSLQLSPELDSEYHKHRRSATRPTWKHNTRSTSLWHKKRLIRCSCDRICGKNSVRIVSSIPRGGNCDKSAKMPLHQCLI